jgi:hypothetical protein
MEELISSVEIDQDWNEYFRIEQRIIRETLFVQLGMNPKKEGVKKRKK